MSTYASVIGAVERCREAYALQQGADGWSCTASWYSTKPEILSQLAQDLIEQANISPMTPQEQDQLLEAVQKMRLSWLTSADSARKKIADCVAHHVRLAPKLCQNQLIQALDYVGRKSDIHRFSVYYSAFFQHQVTPDDSAALKSTLDAIPTSRWLHRAVEDPTWICGLAPKDELVAFPKPVDLRQCEVQAIDAVLRAHQAFSALTVTLDCPQAELIQLKELRDFNLLDLTACPAPIDFRVIERSLPRCDIRFPSHLLHPEIRGYWPSTIRPLIEQRLKSLQCTRPEELARFARFMKGSSWSGAWELYLANFILILQKSPEPNWNRLSFYGMLQATCHSVQVFTPSNLRYLYLNYCSSITKDGFDRLPKPAEHFSVMGCLQVDDDCFLHHWLLTQPNSYRGEVDLRCTKVTQEMVQKLKVAQPQATFFHDDAAHFQADLTDIDGQGLSTEALQVMLFIVHYRYFPPLTQRVCMEIICSRAVIFNYPAIHDLLKAQCRYTLQVNVTQENVLELLRFGLDTQDGALIDVCRNFMEIFDIQGPCIGNVSQLPTKKQLPNDQNLGPIYLSANAAPLADLVEANNIRAFRARLQKLDAQDALQRMVTRFPNCGWLKFLHNGQLDCTDSEFIMMCEADLFSDMRLLDLRNCRPFSYKRIEPYLLALDNLHNILFPADLLDIPESISHEWSPGKEWLLQLNLLKIMKLGRLYTSIQLVEIACIILNNNRFCVKGGLRWDILHKPLMNFLLSSLKDRKRAIFGPVVDFAGLEIITTELISSLQFQDAPLELNLAFCRNVTNLAPILALPKLQKLTLYGCTQITDGCFTDISFKGSLDLRYTGVSNATVERLRESGIKVLHHQRGSCPFQLMPVERALDLYTDATEKQNLRAHIICNITASTCLRVYRLGQAQNDPLMRCMARAYIELFCPEITEVASDPTDPYPLDLAFDLYKLEDVGQTAVKAMQLLSLNDFHDDL